MAFKKIGFEYFKLYLETANDPKLHYLIQIAGVSAFGIWTLILTDIYRSGGWIRWGKMEARMFARRFGIPEQELSSAIAGLIRSGLFSRRLLQSGYLSSKGIQKRVREMCIECRRAPPEFPQHIEITEDEPSDLSSIVGTEEEEKRIDQIRSDHMTIEEIHNVEESRNMHALCIHNVAESRTIPNNVEASKKELAKTESKTIQQQQHEPLNFPEFLSAETRKALTDWQAYLKKNFKKDYGQMQLESDLMRWHGMESQLAPDIRISISANWRQLFPGADAQNRQRSTLAVPTNGTGPRKTPQQLRDEAFDKMHAQFKAEEEAALNAKV